MKRKKIYIYIYKEVEIKANDHILFKHYESFFLSFERK